MVRTADDREVTLVWDEANDGVSFESPGGPPTAPTVTFAEFPVITADIDASGVITSFFVGECAGAVDEGGAFTCSIDRSVEDGTMVWSVHLGPGPHGGGTVTEHPSEGHGSAVTLTVVRNRWGSPTCYRIHSVLGDPSSARPRLSVVDGA